MCLVRSLPTRIDLYHCQRTTRMASSTENAASQPAPFIYINGYPGVGKLTIAKELRALFPQAQLVSSHSTIDITAEFFPRGHPQYQSLRRALRRVQFQCAINAPYETTWIFTDQQSSSEIGSSTAQEYQTAAASRGSRFISIVLTCGAEENFKRAQSKGRGGALNTKLTDLSILRKIRAEEEIYHFGSPEEAELDVTGLTPSEAARQIYQHVCRFI